MIQPYPSAAQAANDDRPPIPRSVLNATRLMYAGAVVNAIGAVVWLVTMSATKAAIKSKHPHLSASTLNTVTSAGVITGAVAAVIGALFFCWLARSCRAGKNWARITATALLAVASLGTLYQLSAAQATADLSLTFVVDLIGLSVVVLLWLGSSSAYFRLFKRPGF